MNWSDHIEKRHWVAVALAGALGVFAACGGDDDGGGGGGSDAGEPADATPSTDARPLDAGADESCLEYFTNTVALVRDDESEVNLTGAETFACCRAYDSEVAPDPAVHLWHRRQSDGAGWQLTVVLADITPEEPLTFPNDFPFDMPEGAALFAMDPPNEASTQQADSSGSVVFHAIDCEAGIELTIDAVAGSELADSPPLSVSGTFAASADPPK